MTDAQAALAQVREALAAGPTPGPWEQKPKEVGTSYIRVRGTRLGCRYKIANVLTPIYDGAHELEAQETRANARLIAACSPLNMSAILAHVEAQAAEIERLRAGLRAVSDLIDESHGVAGLHRNGAVAPWGDLRTGGRYEEWLVSFDDAMGCSNE